MAYTGSHRIRSVQSCRFSKTEAPGMTVFFPYHTNDQLLLLPSTSREHTCNLQNHAEYQKAFLEFRLSAIPAPLISHLPQHFSSTTGNSCSVRRNLAFSF